MDQKSILKGYFETGDKPTEAQFAELIDSMTLQTEFGALSKNVQCLETTVNKVSKRVGELESQETFQIVSELPSEPKENVVYLIPSANSGGSNVLTEWICINGVWEQLGEFKQSDYNEEDPTRPSFIRNKPGFIYVDMSNYESAKASIEKYDLLDKQGSALPCLFKHIDADKAVPCFMGIHKVWNATGFSSVSRYRIDFCIPIVTTTSELSYWPEFVYTPGASLNRLSVHSYLFDDSIGVLTYLGKTISPSSEILRITMDLPDELKWADIVASLPKYPVRISCRGYAQDPTTEVGDEDYLFDDPPGILMGGDTAFFLKDNQLKAIKITDKGFTKINGSNYPMLTHTRIFENGFDNNQSAIIEALESGMDVRIKYKDTWFSVLSWRKNGDWYYVTITGNVSNTTTTVYIFELKKSDISIIISYFTLEDFAKKSDIHIPDWDAQESEAGYIKNRTHYIGPFDEVHSLKEEDSFLVNCDPATGTTIKVVADGVSTVKFVPYSEKADIGGCIRVSVPSDGDDTRMITRYDPSDFSEVLVYVADGNRIHQISELYIPDSIARKPDVDALAERVAALEEIINQITTVTEE